MMNGKEHTSSGFDQLLSLAMLERNDLFNEANNETMAQQVFASAGDILVAENKNVLEKLNTEFGRKGSRKWWLNILIIAVIAGAAITVVVMNSGSNVTVNTQTVNGNSPVPENQQVILTSGEHTPERKLQRDPEMVMPVMHDSVAEVVEAPVAINVNNSPGTPSRLYLPGPVVDYEKDIPVLTNADIESNSKKKLEMLRAVFKKKSYAFTSIPAGTAWRNGKRIEVKEFSLQCAEVSNWQYNVFLNDLIAQGRTDDYLAAKPVDGNWAKTGIPEFEKVYAKDKGYEKFPVLNIPRAGAEMYCAWFSDEMSKAIDNREVKNNDGKRPQFRLPSDVEWIRAARGNYDSTMQFPWGYRVNALQNSKGCYLCNFNYGISKDVLTPIEADGKNCISEKKTTRSIITTAGRAIDTLVLGPEYCYNPTDFGTYCMMGNAAEMVWTYDETQPAVQGAARAMGGSWYSHADEVRIESKEQFVGVTEGNVNIGFRVVMTYASQ